MKYKITGYEPNALFQYFEEISAIPRGSGNEKAISEYLIAFAKTHNLQCYHDELNNVVIKKPATKGYEKSPAVMLQGHQDMVCEKNNDVIHDFEKDGIDLIVENGFVRANGTTLGADNGIAVAMMLALLSADDLKHPALECVFTVEEEVGLNGAAGLDASVLDARIMINLDSEEEGIATVSCAGGMRYTMKKDASYETIKQPLLLSIAVKGLLGGHSGSDIHLERGNANKIMGRLLQSVLKETKMQLVSIKGGNKDNAIPRECISTLAFSNQEERNIAFKILEGLKKDLLEELHADEPSFAMEIKQSEDDSVDAWTRKETENIINLIFLSPDGAQKRNVRQGGFIVASLNMGVVESNDKGITIVFAPRSSISSLQEEIVQRLTLLTDEFGFQYKIAGQYPGWSFAEESKIRDAFVESFHRLFGKELQIEAIHAGLECGLFADKLPGLDAIAVGPTMRNCHTPNETMDLASCERTWKLLTDVLEGLCIA
ncbi:aminoacyl-histidine dipeptidase [Anaerovorax sp. IOR16]|uniref:aminoacyl-histidine dipeptidase n=1 Tax=Anaerovorax sp. IOR16 TaxID=2773458 RepID=UPI0019D0B1DA|nr:aminoacyl-histidine dipeptidase [Anaerovorax sp. IOR16]